MGHLHATHHGPLALENYDHALRKAQLQSLLQQQWAQRAGPGKPATSVTVGQVVHQARQQAQSYKRLLLAMAEPMPDWVPCHAYVLVGMFNVCRLWPA
jgi:hypothetical protein